jgi:methylene-tetrahydromethanopterin dehydrogenase
MAEKTMEAPFILHMLSPLRHVSPFDVNMALDAGFSAVLPYTGVEEREVKGLVQDAIFSRGPKGVKRTAIFIGGKNAILALDMLEEARHAMVPPFVVSVFADPAGSFTTAAAMVACVEKTLKAKLSSSLRGRRVATFGATGVVGFSAAVIAAQEGAQVTLVGYDGVKRVKDLAANAKSRFDVELAYADGSNDALKTSALEEAEIILCAAAAGVQVIGRQHLDAARALELAADVNAVPPAGVEGVGVQDDGAPIAGTSALGIGALAIGNVKYKVEAGLFRKMIDSPKALYLDFRDAYALAREIIG